MNDKKASVAYILHSNYWGKGYATQALPLMINKLIKEYEIIEFEACIDTRNTKSIELVKRLGFEYTGFEENADFLDRKSTRLNSSHVAISYAVFCLKKKKNKNNNNTKQRKKHRHTSRLHEYKTTSTSTIS